jgi:hypothetical protein
MIQYGLVRSMWTLLLLGSASLAAATETEPVTTVAVYWQPPGAIASGPAVRAAFARAMAAKHAIFVDGTAAPAPAPSLAPELAAAVAEYNAFHFAEAAARLSELQRLADAKGGADLDGRQLSEIYLYRGMARLELGQADLAWDDIVRAARLDPARMLDREHFPPRVVAAFRRALADAAQLPRAELEVVAPADARVRVDGRPAVGPVAVPLGPHLVGIDADGLEPWSGVVTVASVHERFAPPLRPQPPPDGDRLLALAGARPAQRIMLGALARSTSGWRLVVRSLELPGLRTIGAEAALEGAPVAHVVDEALQRLDAVRPAATAAQAPRGKSRWWIWAVGGGVTAALAIALPVGIIYSRPSSAGTVGGALAPLH